MAILWIRFLFSKYESCNIHMSELLNILQLLVDIWVSIKQDLCRVHSVIKIINGEIDSELILSSSDSKRDWLVTACDMTISGVNLIAQIIFTLKLFSLTYISANNITTSSVPAAAETILSNVSWPILLAGHWSLYT